MSLIIVFSSKFTEIIEFNESFQMLIFICFRCTIFEVLIENVIKILKKILNAIKKLKISFLNIDIVFKFDLT